MGSCSRFPGDREIHDTKVLDDTLVVTAIHFEHTRVETARVQIENVDESLEAGKKLTESIPHDGLRHAFVLSDGLMINGTMLVEGLKAGLPAGTSLTGGLSADGDRFEETLVLWEERATSGTVAILGLYGDRLQVGYGSLGGWDSFGPERLITKSNGNVLYEVDGQSVLSLYKKYLGEHAAGLPATGLLFPLSVRTEMDKEPVVRTLLSVDEGEQSMTFAGDMPEGAFARLMKANSDRLIEGAEGAARVSSSAMNGAPSELAILISCVGRKLVLKHLIEEEVESVREILGPDTTLAGFYSYGEISPFSPGAKCELHNQTMTVTTFSEKAA